MDLIRSLFYACTFGGMVLALCPEGENKKLLRAILALSLSVFLFSPIVSVIKKGFPTDFGIQTDSGSKESRLQAVGQIYLNILSEQMEEKYEISGLFLKGETETEETGACLFSSVTVSSSEPLDDKTAVLLMVELTSILECPVDFCSP